MNWLFSLYVAILFFILTPAILLRIPKNGNKYTVAGVHAIVFALLLHFTGKFVWNFSMSMEGFSEGLTQEQISALQTKAQETCSKNGGKWENNKCNTTGVTPAQQNTIRVLTQKAKAKGETQCTKAVSEGGWCDKTIYKDGCQVSNGCFANGAKNKPPGRGYAKGDPIATPEEMQAWGFAN
jgi:hypothetical protein